MAPTVRPERADGANGPVRACRWRQRSRQSVPMAPTVPLERADGANATLPVIPVHHGRELSGVRLVLYLNPPGPDGPLRSDLDDSGRPCTGAGPSGGGGATAAGTEGRRRGSRRVAQGR